MGSRLLLLLLLLLLLPPLAVVLAAGGAGAGPVVTGHVGIGLPRAQAGALEESGDLGTALGASVGWRFDEFVQWDAVEFGYVSAPQQDAFGSTPANQLALGTAVRLGIFRDSARLHPYASFGFGGSRTSWEIIGFPDVDEWGFEWSAGGGFLYNFTPTMAAGLRYRYRGATLDSLPGAPQQEVDVRVHAIEVELSFGH